MQASSLISKNIGRLLFLAAVATGLYLSSIYSYLLFHTLIELFSILVAGTIFILVWNFKRFFSDSFLVFIGTAYLAFGFIDLIHTLAYRGMFIFRGYDTNLPTQLWIAARYLQSISLLIAPLFLRRTVNTSWILGGFTLVTTLLLLSIFAWDIFPVSFIEGSGLTPFKIVSEYIINLILLGAIAFLWSRRQYLNRRILILLIASLVFTIGGELAFTFYIDVYSFSNLVGHFFKLIAFYLIYKSIIETAATTIYTDVTELRRAQAALRASEARERARATELEALMDAVPTIVWVTRDPECRVVTGNPASYEMLRMPYGSNPSKSAPEGEAPEHYRVFKDGVELQPHEMPLQVSARQGVEIVDYEMEICFEDGESRFLLGNVTPLLDYQGKPSGAIAAFMDITERKQAEADLERYAQQLEVSNQDLEQFAFVASHDLQEPLRKVKAFGERLQKNLEGRLEDKDMTFLDRMVNASDRMQAMIDSLLTYARVATKANPFTEVDLNQTVQEVLVDLESRLESTHGKVQVDELPVIEADPQQMRQLFQNLIGNALKFHPPDTPPEVQVSCKDGVSGISPAARKITLRIKDNGIGFDVQYLERIFRPFERLHGRGVYEGTGMGLAICKRIVERHGGEITADSAPGRGSQFIVTLPVSQKP